MRCEPLNVYSHSATGELVISCRPHRHPDTDAAESSARLTSISTQYNCRLLLAVVRSHGQVFRITEANTGGACNLLRKLLLKLTRDAATKAKKAKPGLSRLARASSKAWIAAARSCLGSPGHFCQTPACGRNAAGQPCRLPRREWCLRLPVCREAASQVQAQLQDYQEPPPPTARKK